MGSENPKERKQSQMFSFSVDWSTYQAFFPSDIITLSASPEADDELYLHVHC